MMSEHVVIPLDLGTDNLMHTSGFFLPRNLLCQSLTPSLPLVPNESESVSRDKIFSPPPFWSRLPLALGFITI